MQLSTRQACVIAGSMVGRTAASQAIQEDAALSTVEAGKLLDLLASMETIGAEDVVDLRQTQGRFVVPQLKGKLAKLQGKLFLLSFQ